MSGRNVRVVGALSQVVHRLQALSDPEHLDCGVPAAARAACRPYVGTWITPIVAACARTLAGDPMSGDRFLIERADRDHAGLDGRMKWLRECAANVATGRAAPAPAEAGTPPPPAPRDVLVRLYALLRDTPAAEVDAFALRELIGEAQEALGDDGDAAADAAAEQRAARGAS